MVNDVPILFSKEYRTIKDIQIYISKGYPVPSDVLDIAARNGYLEIMIWLSKKYPYLKFTNDALEGASECGHLQVVKWLYTNNVIKNMDIKTAILYAEENGNTSIVNWLSLTKKPTLKVII